MWCKHTGIEVNCFVFFFVLKVTESKSCVVLVTTLCHCTNLHLMATLLSLQVNHESTASCYYLK